MLLVLFFFYCITGRYYRPPKTSKTFSDLRAAEKALAEAKKTRDNLLETIFKRYPHLQPKSDTLTLYIKRSKEETKALSKLEKVTPQQFIDADFKQHREL